MNKNEKINSDFKKLAKYQIKLINLKGGDVKHEQIYKYKINEYIKNLTSKGIDTKKFIDKIQCGGTLDEIDLFLGNLRKEQENARNEANAKIEDAKKLAMDKKMRLSNEFNNKLKSGADCLQDLKNTKEEFIRTKNELFETIKRLTGDNRDITESLELLKKELQDSNAYHMQELAKLTNDYLKFINESSIDNPPATKTP